MKNFKALLAVKNDKWMSLFEEAFREFDFEIHLTSDGKTAFDLARRDKYDVLLIDDSLSGSLEQKELLLNLRDVKKELPYIMITGPEVKKYSKLWDYCDVDVAERRRSLVDRIPSILKNILSSGN